jgi:hypothetical protein
MSAGGEAAMAPSILIAEGEARHLEARKIGDHSQPNSQPTRRSLSLWASVGAPAKELGRDLMPFGPKINAFLAAIRVMPNVTRAAKAARINKSQHYAKLKSSPEYAAAFQQALQIGCDALSDVAVTRATDGWEEPIVYQGKIALQKDPDTGNLVAVMVRKFDNRLLQFILERRHPEYRERGEESGTDDIHRIMENLNLGRQRVAEEQAEREAQDQPDSTPSAPRPV